MFSIYNNDMERLYIFLDIDGVLNKESDWRRHPFTINQECFHNLIQLVERLKDYDIRFILTSTWRSQNLDELRERLKPLKIVGTTPFSSNPNKKREDEILHFKLRNNIHKYLVIDDDKSLFYQPTALNLYITNYKMGFQASDVKRILRLIKKEKC